jgi:hypothetical protein
MVRSLDPKDIQNYLNKGYIVTITGSKYFTGPPYAGAYSYLKG